LAERAVRLRPNETAIFVTGQVPLDLVGTPWHKRLQPVDVEPIVPQLAEIKVYRLGKPKPVSPEPP
jgi:hypothetical protein